MADERILRTDADTIVGVPVCPEGTPLTLEARKAIKTALLAQIVADELLDEAEEAQRIYFRNLGEAVDVAAVVSWDDQSTILPLWEVPPDDLFQEVLSAGAAEECQALYQLSDADLLGKDIAIGLEFAPTEHEIAVAKSALQAAVIPPIDI